MQAALPRPIREEDQIVIAHGRGSGELARSVGNILDLPVVDLRIREYPDQQATAAIPRDGEEGRKNNLRDKRMIFFGSTPSIGGISPSDALVDFALAADVLGRAQVKEVNQVVLYQPFAREDRTKGEVIALSAKVAIDIMTLYPPAKTLIVEPHTEYLELAFPKGIYPQFLWTTNFIAANVAHALSQFDVRQSKVKSLGPDHGAKVRTAQFTNVMRNVYNYGMNPHFGLADKDRLSPDSTRLLGLNGRGALRWAWVVETDDILGSGGTQINPAAAAKKKGASVVLGAAAHGVLTRDQQGEPQILAELNKRNPALDGVILTNTLQIPDSVRNHPRVWVLDIAPYLALAIHEAFAVPFPNKPNGQQGSLRAVNRGEVKAQPQEMPAALREILQAKVEEGKASLEAARSARALRRPPRTPKVGVTAG